MTITAKVNTRTERLLNGLEDAIDLMQKISDSSDNEVFVDFSQSQFVSPLFVLPFMVYAAGCGKKVKFLHKTDYMETIAMGTGMRPDDMRSSEFRARMEAYTHKTYIPIINFPAEKNRDDEKNAILSSVESIIIRQSGITPNVAAGLKYMIEESVDNIIEHSQSERGYIFTQAYPKKRHIDICIADMGITLLGSYKTLPDNEIESDIEAIQAANRGISTKNLPEAENRGYGIITSKKMLVDGLKGSYIMISGNAMHIKNPNIHQFLHLPDAIRWNGTIIAFRIPYTNNAFQYVNYIE